MATDTRPRTPGRAGPPGTRGTRDSSATPATPATRDSSATPGAPGTPVAAGAKTGTPAKPAKTANPAIPAKPRPPRPARPARPGRPARPIGSPRHTRPVVPGPVRPSGAQATPLRPAPSPAVRGPAEPRRQRMPFILLLVGLLGGALVSLLVISTTLDAGAYRINTLTQQNAAYTKDIQMLTNQVQTEQNPETIYHEAFQLGMRKDKNMGFLNPDTGKISSVTPAAIP